MIAELSGGLLSALNSVRFAFGDPDTQTKEVVKKYVEDAWNNEKLPYQLKPGVWVVGWKVHKTFFNCFVYPIMVGPAKPTRLRKRHYKDVTAIAGW